LDEEPGNLPGLKRDAPHEARVIVKVAWVLIENHHSQTLLVRPELDALEEGVGRNAGSPQYGKLKQLELLEIDSAKEEQLSIASPRDRQRTPSHKLARVAFVYA
jgi:hypothetical protein